MSKFITFSSLFLAWAFFEKSGGFDFVPASERQTASVETGIAVTEQADFAAYYVPFENPIIVPSGSPIVAGDFDAGAVTGIVSASFDGAVEEATVQQVALTVDASLDNPAVLNQDIRVIAGDRVNVREGPGTGYAVIDTLARGTEAEILEVTGDDWAQIRLLEDENVVWVAAWLLSD